MVEKFVPEINKVYFVNHYTLFHILSGHGRVQVDFKNYQDLSDKAIYLEKGQYIKFLSDDFVVRKIEFANEERFRNPDTRVLFKHLIAVGYIDVMECEDCQRYLENSALSNSIYDIVDVSSEQWFWQNPFKASKEEYQVIFDVKEVIDQSYFEHLSSEELAKMINADLYNPQALVKNKIGISIKSMLGRKRLTESQKNLAFTDKNIQEVAFDLGYKDDAYFNRVFKNKTGLTPKAFRDNFDFVNRDRFTQDILELLRAHHTDQRSLGFYADKMHLSVKTLSKNVRHKMNATLGQLIRAEVLNSAKLMLMSGEKISVVSNRLNFEEANHFSRYFKQYTGETPSQFQNKKYNS